MLGRIIYTSTSSCQADDIPRILDSSRISNRRRDVTGALLLVHGRFLQYLEGDEATVIALYESISRDTRHTDCKLLDRRLISTRIFAGWNMTWLPNTRDTDLLIDALVPANSRLDALDATSSGAFFYALSKLSQRL